VGSMRPPIQLILEFVCLGIQRQRVECYATLPQITGLRMCGAIPPHPYHYGMWYKDAGRLGCYVCDPTSSYRRLEGALCPLGMAVLLETSWRDKHLSFHQCFFTVGCCMLYVASFAINTNCFVLVTFCCIFKLVNVKKYLWRVGFSLLKDI
jgi:hypothetical protein